MKNIVIGILWFCGNMLNKKSEDQTDILACQVSPSQMANKAIDKLLTGSIDKGLINNEKELIVEKNVQ